MKYELKTAIALGLFAMSPFMASNAMAQEYETARPLSQVTYPNIPNPADVEVTRRNYDRIISLLVDQGLTHNQIQRWLNASFDAHPGKLDIPNPADIEVTRRNYDRIVGLLSDKGLDRKGIKRWINASLDAHQERPERVLRPERAERLERPERPERAERLVRVERPTRVVRLERAVRPVRVAARPVVAIARPTRP